MIFSERKRLFLSLFLTSASLLSYEVFLTRVISAMFVKYFSLLAISMALMGLGAAGVLVQVNWERFSAPKQSFYLTLAAFALPASLFFFPVFVSLVRVPSFFLQMSDLWNLFLFITVCILPFLFGGIILARTYHQFSEMVGKLYFSDLLGAACGCALAFFVLNLTDGLSAVLLSALLSAGVTVIICLGNSRRQVAAAWTVAVFILLSFGLNHWGRFIKLPHPGGPSQTNEWERWSEFGFTTVAKSTHFSGVGVSAESKPVNSKLFKAIRHDYNSLTLAVDASIQGEQLERFKDQLVNFPVRFKEKPKVLVLGSGGGKEVFGALVCGAEEVIAVEFNRVIVQDIVMGYLKDFTGDIYHNPKVKILVDEARNYLNRTREKFDIILPITGTTPRLMAASCYVFSTEYLQTKEAYRSYLEHLAPKGIFSLKASVRKADLNVIKPHYRLLATIKDVLRESGRSPREHVMVVGGPVHASYGADYTMLVLFSPTVFSEDDVNRAQELARRMGFDVIFSQFSRQKGLLSRFLSAESSSTFFQHSADIDIHPVVDERPYYYHHLKLGGDWKFDEVPEYFRLLLVISLIFLGYVVLLIILPVVVSPNNSLRKGFIGNLAALLYFACLGMGFIGLELTLMQKANFLLGIPSWGFLVTVLSFTLFMGLGALAAGKTQVRKIKKMMWLMLSLVAIILGIYAYLFPALLVQLVDWPNLNKMGLVFLLFAPLGFLLGMPFVWGIRTLRESGRGKVTAWMWAVNSTTSTMGAVGITMLWLRWGHTDTLLACLGIYLLAAVLLSFFPSPRKTTRIIRAGDLRCG